MSEEKKKINKDLPTVESFVPEFTARLIEQLRGDLARWGNTWHNRPKEGQELRTMYRYDDYFDMFRETGEPVPWLKIVGGALICWIRDNHPELCIDVNEAEDEGKLVDKDWEDYLDRHPGECDKTGTPYRDEKQSKVETKELIGVKVSPEGSFPIFHDLKPVIETTKIKEAIADGDREVCEKLCTDEIRNACRKEHVGDLESEKAVEDMTTKELVELPRPNPVSHINGEVLDDWKTGILAYAPRHENDGKLVRESIVFTTGSMGKEVLLAKCDKDGFIARGSEGMWIEGTMDNNGKYVISSTSGFDVRVNYTLSVSYTYEYFIPKDG